MSQPTRVHVEIVGGSEALTVSRVLSPRISSEAPPPLARVRDWADVSGIHAVARLADGTAIGIARMDSHGEIESLAVLPEWRGRGTATAMLTTLLEAARAAGIPHTRVHSPPALARLFCRAGFVAVPAAESDAGAASTFMRRLEGSRFAISTLDSAIATTITVIASARRALHLRTRDLDPGLYDHPDVLAALRHFATRRHTSVRILLHDPDTVQRRGSAVIELARRLPGSFALRAVDDPVDHAFNGAFLVNDAGGFHSRVSAQRIDGDAATAMPGLARQLAHRFDPVWERSRSCPGLRALDL